MSDWNGVPPNEEYRGWHWLYLYNGIPIPAYWDTHWLINGQRLKVEDLNPNIKYWGQCLTPSEIEAKDARIAELEAALKGIKHLTLTTHQYSKYSANYLRIIDIALAGGKDG